MADENKNKEFLYKILRSCHKLYEFLPQELANNKDFFISNIYCIDDLHILRHSSSELKNNKDFLIKVAEEAAANYEREEFDLDIDLYKIYDYCEDDNTIFMNANKELLKDREFVKKIISIIGEEFAYLENALTEEEDQDLLDKYLEDRELILLSSKSYDCLRNVTDLNIKNDREFVTQLIINIPHNYRYISDNLKEDEQLFKLAVENSCKEHIIYIFQYTSSKLQDDENLVLYMKDIYCDIRYISERLRDDKEIVMQINGKENSNLFPYLSERLKDDIDVVRKFVIEGSAINLEGVSKRLMDEEEIAQFICDNRGYKFQYLSERLRNTFEIAKKCVDEYRYNITYVTDVELKKRLEELKE